MATNPPTDQRAAVRPISFALEDMGAIVSSVTLHIRPEELTRTEPNRVSVHQTMGRDVQGWVDDFGPGLPVVNIRGNTGWRGGENVDGAKAFELLHKIVQEDYPRARQGLVDSGIDPSLCKLIFADLLDGFIYPVVPAPGGFVLQRSRSRPLLFQYQIQLQAIGTSIDNPERFIPQLASVPAAVAGLESVSTKLDEMLGSVRGWVSAAGAALPVADAVRNFVGLTSRVLAQVTKTVNADSRQFDSATNGVLQVARDLAQAGRNVTNTVAVLSGSSSSVRARIAQIGAEYNEAACIFSNALKPRRVYQGYDDLYGASHCSSTTFGRPPSAYEGQNIWPMVTAEKQSAVSVSPDAGKSIARLLAVDPVLGPMGMNEIGSHLAIINAGVRVAA